MVVSQHFYFMPVGGIGGLLLCGGRHIRGLQYLRNLQEVWVADDIGECIEADLTEA